MPTIAELRSSIRNQLVGHVPTDDVRLRSRFIDKVIRDKRSLIIHQGVKKGLGVDSRYYQVLDCLDLECRTVECRGVPSGIEEVYAELPETEGFPGSIAYVGDVSGLRPFAERTISSFLNSAPNRFGAELPIWTLRGGELLIRHCHPRPKVIRVIAVLQDPSTNKCITEYEKKQYPVPGHVVHQLEVLCLRQLLSTIHVENDQDNDGRDTSQLQSRQAGLTNQDVQE